MKIFKSKKTRKIMITGAYGFIGSNFLNMWLKENKEDEIILVDSMTYASNPKFLISYISKNFDISLTKRIYDEIIDIRDSESVNKIMSKYEPDFVFHFAAESHVCRSIDSPVDFVTTNVYGTFNLIEAFRIYCGNESKKRFIHVSTDEVFGELESYEQPFNEKSDIKPRSPYAASKASSDHIVMSYFHTYGTNVIVTNCSNNFGPNQNEEKLIPATIKRILKGEGARIYGTGNNVRDWVFVEDHCKALMLLAEKGKARKRYCVGGEFELKNSEMVELIYCAIEKALKKEFPRLIKQTKDRPTDDKRYAINADKIKEIGWDTGKHNFFKNLSFTVEYYLKEYRQAGAESEKTGIFSGGFNA